MSSLATQAGTARDKASGNPYVQASLREPKAPGSIGPSGVIPSGPIQRRTAGPRREIP